MATVAVLQPSYLPWLGHFDQIQRSDFFVFYDDVQFDKHGWRNRNRVKAANGAPHWLTVPVLHSGQSKPLIKDIRIDQGQAWVRKQVGTIKQFYSQSPHLPRYLPEFVEILEKKQPRLIDLALETTFWLARHLGIDGNFFRSSELDIQGEPTERLVKICKHFGAKTYLTGNLAKNYLDVNAFEIAGIEVEWQNYHHPEYAQLNGPFLPHLSSLDLLLNMGPESPKVTRESTIFREANP